MPQHEHAALPRPARMTRIAVVAPRARLREALVALADAGTVELSGTPPSATGEAVEALRRLERRGVDGARRPQITPAPPDPAELERLQSAELLAGEVELERRAAAAVEHGSFSALVGWTPADAVGGLTDRLAEIGAAAVELPAPPWLEPPTLIARAGLSHPFRPLVETYGSAHYADLDPTPFAAASFVAMFGVMFGDVAHGLLLAAMALGLRRVTHGPLLAARRVWPVPFAAGLAAAVTGLLYGECFGPTGLVPTLWRDPIDNAETLLVVALVLGALLLAQSYALGTVNRWREGGPAAALVAPSAIAGAAVFAGGLLLAAGWYLDGAIVLAGGGLFAVAGLGLLAVGFASHAGRGGLAAVEVSVEVLDAAVRVGASTISFMRLAAFGVMHAALGLIVWDAASAAWGGVAGTALAAVVMVAGNVVAFSLELLVAGVQALRLEYYELFSRIFAGEGHVFAPWHIPLVTEEET